MTPPTPTRLAAPRHAQRAPMSPSAEAARATTRLLPRQTRVIHASEGLTIQVLQGRLWLTRPGDQTDRFLREGESLELTQDWVVVQADAAPNASHGQPEHVMTYRLVHTRHLVNAPGAVHHRWWSAVRTLLGVERRPGRCLAT